MTRNSKDFQYGRSPKCDTCGGPLDHIHLTPETVDSYRAISEAANMHAQMAEHMRQAPTKLNDRASLASHLMSNGHLASLRGDESHATLMQMHDEDHRSMEEGPADERENFTTLGDEHFHH